MELFKQYQKIISSHLEEMRSNRQPAVIFGAGRSGWYVMKVLEFYHVLIAAFCDNDPGKQNTYYDYQVFSPGQVAADFPKARVFLGIFIPATAEVVQRQFHQLGFQHVYYDTEAFLFTYLVEVAGRQCDRKKLAESIHVLFENYREGAIHYGWTKTHYYVSPFVSSVITQKCSLRCRDCAQLIPYYQEPVHFPVASVIEDLKQYAKAFDVVPEISLHGGEPFLHPRIAEICKEAAAIPNIVFISFITNGTIMLAEDVLRQLSACGADVHMSGGYGALSKKRDALSEAFRKHGIYFDILYCLPTEMWMQPAPFRKHARSDAANNALFKKCMSTKTCCQIMDGELHRCALSMHGSHQGLFPKKDADFVRFHPEDPTDRNLTTRIRCFLDRECALTVCDYCDPEGDTPVTPAIQLS